MPKITRRAFAASSAAAAAAAVFGFEPALAQAYPARPVTVIVPWGAGGGTDATARIVFVDEFDQVVADRMNRAIDGTQNRGIARAYSRVPHACRH